MYNIIMTIDDQVRNEKLQYDINREAVKKSALSSEKIIKYEYLTGEEILAFTQKQLIEQPSWQSFWKINKNNSRSRKKNKSKQFKIKHKLKQPKIYL